MFFAKLDQATFFFKASVNAYHPFPILNDDFLFGVNCIYDTHTVWGYMNYDSQILK